MSDYEKLNQKIAVQKAVRRRDAHRRTAYLLGIVLATVLAFVGLEYIGFISKLFMVILVSGASLVGAFHAGRIWSDYKR